MFVNGGAKGEKEEKREGKQLREVGVGKKKWERDYRRKAWQKCDLFSTFSA